MILTRKQLLAVSAAVLVSLSGCTLVKPIACAAVYPFEQFGKAAKPKDRSLEHSELPPAGVIVAAPVLIPLKYVYYVSYGLVGGLVSDLNLITGHGSWKNSVRTLYEPMRTNAVK